MALLFLVFANQALTSQTDLDGTRGRLLEDMTLQLLGCRGDEKNDMIGSDEWRLAFPSDSS